MPFGRRSSLAKGCDIERSSLDGALRYLFLTAVILATFAFGWRVGTFEKFPHAILFKAYKTAKTQIQLLTNTYSRSIFVNIAPDSVKAHRFEFVAVAALADRSWCRADWESSPSIVPATPVASPSCTPVTGESSTLPPPPR